MKKMMIAAAAMMLSAPLFAAEAESLVVVKQVLANDAKGEPRVLFSDKAGAVMKIGGLAHIDELLHVNNINGIGNFSNLHVVIEQQGRGEAVLKLDGQLQVTENFVGANVDLTLAAMPSYYAATSARVRDNG